MLLIQAIVEQKAQGLVCWKALDPLGSELAIEFLAILEKSLLWAYIEVWHRLNPAVSAVSRFFLYSVSRSFNFDVSIFRSTVWVEELALKVNDSIAIPVHLKARLFNNVSNESSFEVFAGSLLHELFNV
jgi:hypothetical protein